MDTSIVVGVIAAASLLVAAAIGAPRIIRDPLSSIAKQVEIYNALPERSAARAALLERIEQQVNRLDNETSARRNPPGIALGVILLVAAGTLTWLVYVAGDWWWVTSPALLLLWMMAVIGMYQGWAKVPRAAGGQSLEYQRRRAERVAAKAGNAPRRP